MKRLMLEHIDDVVQLCRRLDTPLILLPLTGLLSRQADPSALFLGRTRDDFHWNRDGHALVAAALGDLVEVYHGVEAAPAR